MEEPTSGGTVASRPRRRRLLWIALGAIVALLVAAALALPALLDVERYRGRIEAALSSATGWQAELGKIDFSPWRGMVLTVQPASLAAPGNTSRFDAALIEIRAELMPLFRGRLAIRSITLVRPEIRLVRNSTDEGWILPAALASEAGAGPASGAGSAGGAAGDPATAGNAPTGRTAGGGGFSVTIDQIAVRDGQVRTEDRAGDPPLNIELDGVDLTLRPTTGEITGRGDLAEGGGHLEWNGNLEHGVTVAFRDLTTDRLQPLIGADLVHAGGSLSGEVEIGFPFEVRGKLDGRRLTLLSGTRPFDTVQVGLHLTSAGEAWRLETLDVDADGVKLTGGGTLLPATALDFQLPATPLAEALRASESVMPLPIDVRPPGEVEARVHVARPVNGKLYYTAKGTLSAAEFRASEMLPPAKDVRAEFDVDRKGAMEIHLLDARVGGGPAEGVARLSSIDPPGKLSFDGGLRDAIFGALLSGFLGPSSQSLTGPTGLNADISLDLGHETIDAHALGGRIDLDSRQVSLPGWDLEGAILSKIEEKAAELNLQSLIQSKLGGRETSSSKPAGSSVERVFDDLAVSVDFNSWPWKLEKLELAADHLSANGNGSFDPANGAIDIRFTAHLDRERTAELVRQTDQLKVLVDKNGQLSLPLRLTGSMLSPSIDVDLGQAFSNQLEKQDTKKKVEGLLKGLLDRKD